MHKITITTNTRESIVDITPQIEKYLCDQNALSGIVTVFSPHTTAGITVNENADPSVKSDMLSFLKKTIPQDSEFTHAEGNSDAHIKGSIVNFSQNFIIEDGKLQLGTWQGVFFMEFDGPRQRQVWLKFISSK